MMDRIFQVVPAFRDFSILKGVVAGLVLCTVMDANSATSATVNFSAKLVGGTCQITVDKPSIDFGSILASDIVTTSPEGTALQLLTLSFSGCSGWGLTPKIQVSGTTITDGIPLFRNTNAAGDYSQGYGVRLVQQGSTTPIASLAKLTVGSASAQLSDLNSQPLKLEARLSCGNCTQTPKGGNLNATVTLQFLYE